MCTDTDSSGIIVRPPQAHNHYLTVTPGMLVCTSVAIER
ncbi:hypothetical protein [Erwinia phage Zoomie]|uniref:Uncharacterized protein n=1 Tax=Erwinia phage Zoomie TaxID=2851072 RepID=A0A9E6N9H3_9CAUD|nr:hypothetical protein [Erwinia phage Zoomie]